MSRIIHESCDFCGYELAPYDHTAAVMGVWVHTDDSPPVRMRVLGGRWACEACFWHAAQLLDAEIARKEWVGTTS